MKKMGRPTDAKKSIFFKLRIDEKTNYMLEECARRRNLCKSEIIRLAIQKLYADLDMEKK